MNSKVGRANVDGSVPLDNPFVDGDGPNNDYVWARGFRNPFTMAFQPSTGELWVNVVGTDWEQIFTPRAGDHGGWNAYESNQPAGYLAPVVSYATDASETHSIPSSGAVRLGGVATVYTTDAHRYRPGTRITIAGVSDASFNGTFSVTETLSANQLSYLQSGPDAVSGNGTTSSKMLGGCVVGGAFWDATSVPADYRGNLFFGDFNSGRILRVVLGSNNRVASVDEWATGADKVVDLVVGFDGDLYYATNNGNVRRIGYAATSQALVVSQRNVRMEEGGQAALSVRLAVPPPTNRNVIVTEIGSGDVTVTEGASLSFTPDNWSVPQRVVLSAGVDPDSVEDTSFVRVASSGLAVEDVAVRVTEGQSRYVVLTPPELELAEAASSSVSVALSEPPSGPSTVAIISNSSKLIASPTELNFTTKDWATPQTVTITALDDDDGADEVTGVRVTLRGLRDRELLVTVRDDDGGSTGGSGAPASMGGSPGLPEGGASPSGGFPASAGAPGDENGGFTADGGQGGMVAVPEGGGASEVEGGAGAAPGTSTEGCGCRLAGASRADSLVLFGAAAVVWQLSTRRRRRGPSLTASGAGRMRRHRPRSAPR
jgi:hypothetical protein